MIYQLLQFGEVPLKMRIHKLTVFLISLKVRSVSEMKRGENQILCKLPLEAMLPLIDVQHNRRVGSKSQMATQIILMWLYEHGKLTDSDMQSIRQRTNIFKTDADFIETKKIKYTKEIQKEKMEVKIEAVSINEERKRRIEKMMKIVQQPIEEWEDYVRDFARDLSGYENTSFGTQILEIIRRKFKEKHGQLPYYLRT